MNRKVLTTVAFLCILPFACLAQEENEPYHYNQDYDYAADTTPVVSYSHASLVKFAQQYLGTPYAAEGKDSTGFDCSGFTFYVYRRYGVYLPYYSFQQANVGETVAVGEAQMGDLVFFKGGDLMSSQAGHVGLVVSKKGEKLKFIHASSSKGVRFDTIDNGYFKPRFLFVKRIPGLN